MIFDHLGRAAHYTALHPAFADALAWLAAFDPATPDGNYAIANGCEARIMTYRTEPAEQKRWESHRRFIDIQFMVAGRERMDVAEISTLHGATTYDEANDVLFYDHAPAGVTGAVVKQGEFTIFFPHDGHRPGITIDVPVDVRKIVIKVPIEASPSRSA